ncbi:hypothetical protein C8Q76DRAFT_794937 [Earliella scabrosa]|nr:hypothetical protein C8Q76DRAFT_794937 [Earliella scabrosa]
MSNTSTASAKATISRAPSLLVSPPKRRKIEGEQLSRTGNYDTREPTGRAQDEEQPQPTATDILRWTFTKAAIASCFVRDVLEMKESGMKDMEYFWLGRIPCRTVRLVGLVVGVQVWEKRTVYTIDDGTGVVDCALAHAQVTPPSPVKPQSRAAPSNTKSGAKAGGPSFADYLPSSRKVAASMTVAPSKRIVAEPPPPPKPVARVGQSARVVGRVIPKFETRIILIDEISLCASYNDESKHCLHVAELHRTTYHPSEPLPPFVPPRLPPHTTTFQYPSTSRPGSPTKRATTQDPVTPASVRSTAPSATASPSTSVANSSPASSTGGEPHVPRLRHPSRLHTRDLTANTFRIYVKHYMDNAPPPSRPRPRPRSDARSVSPSPTPRSSQAKRNRSLNPPRSSNSSSSRGRSGVDATPRPSRVQNAADRTPRASCLPCAPSDDEDSADEDDGDDKMYGYTLSHLRRVPELSLLAHRVVKADAHRRAKEERKTAKSQGGSSRSTAAPGRSSQSEDALRGPAVKRLFKQAIRTLFSEGDIVLWSGPIRPLPDPALDLLVPSSSALWKANTSTSSTAPSSRSAISYEEWDEEVLSDPTPGEEAYVPLTPAYFSRVLEDAIRTIMAEAARSVEATPKPKSAPGRGVSLIDRLRAQEKENKGPPPGPTKEELLAWLRNSDERWARVGEWSVEEALHWGRREGRLWCVGKGRWEICG